MTRSTRGKRAKPEAKPEQAEITPAGFSRYPVICPAGHQFNGETFAVDGREGAWCADHAPAASRGEQPRVPSFAERTEGPNAGGFENRVTQGGREHTRGEGTNTGGFEARAKQKL